MLFKMQSLKRHKVIVLGDTGVGKTSIIKKYCCEPYNVDINSNKNTIGVDLKISCKLINGVWQKMQIWDTAGQERFRSIISAFYHDVNGVMLVYDINKNKEDSIESLKYWYGEVLKKNPENTNIQFMILCNKCDQNYPCGNIINNDDIRNITGNDDDSLHNVPVIITNTIDNTNINYVFDKLFDMLIENNNMDNIIDYISVDINQSRNAQSRWRICC